MENELHQDGTITVIKEWKTGKGYFLQIGTSKEDFYAFGTPKAQVKDYVTIYFKNGTGNFADKKQITKIELIKDSGPAKTSLGNEPPEQAGERPAGPKPSLSDTTKNINRAVALKAAIELVKATIKPGAKIDLNVEADGAIEIAERLEKYLNGE